jgi:hypothetical protein
MASIVRESIRPRARLDAIRNRNLRASPRDQTLIPWSPSSYPSHYIDWAIGIHLVGLSRCARCGVEKNLLTLLGFNAGSFDVYPVPYSLHWLSYPASQLHKQFYRARRLPADSLMNARTNINLERHLLISLLRSRAGAHVTRGADSTN